MITDTHLSLKNGWTVSITVDSVKWYAYQLSVWPTHAIPETYDGLQGRKLERGDGTWICGINELLPYLREVEALEPPSPRK